jgi:tetratricopeptide (TPR) repeat protein
MEGAKGHEEGIGMGKGLSEWVAASILFAIVAALAVGAHARNSLWKSEIDLWEDCIRKAPQKERTHHNLGFAYYEVGRWEEAQREFGKALTLNPRHTLSMYNLGLVYYRKGMMEKAIDCCLKTLDLNCPPPDTYFNLGLAYCQRGRYSDAVKSFKRLLRMKPDYRNAYHHLGLAYQGSKQWDRAIESYRAELERNPENPDSYLCLGDLYLERKNYPKALVHFKKALAYPHLSGADRVRKIVSSIEGTPRLKNGRKSPTALNNDPSSRPVPLLREERDPFRGDS